MNVSYINKRLSQQGYATIENVFSNDEINAIISVITQADEERPNFRKTTDLFAIRQFLKEVPAAIELLFSENFSKLISALFGNDYFVVKSIYFDKPKTQIGLFLTTKT